MSPVVVDASSLWSTRQGRSPRSSARSPVERRARTGPYGAQKSTGSPIRAWRKAVPVFIARQFSTGQNRPPWHLALRGSGTSSVSGAQHTGSKSNRMAGLKHLRPGQARPAFVSPMGPDKGHQSRAARRRRRLRETGDHGRGGTRGHLSTGCFTVTGCHDVVSRPRPFRVVRSRSVARSSLPPGT
jgi:hypothetical protein